ncbi:MAG: DUF2442 domain-containing protein [Firmicutes bacterium]|nr:DUF2442 domain-containing protein [Bacillota bacterium]
MRPQLKAVIPEVGYKLRLQYSNGEKRIYDASKLLANPLNRSLENLAIFETAKLSGCGVEWCNGIDICPDELYSFSLKVI